MKDIITYIGNNYSFFLDIATKIMLYRREDPSDLLNECILLIQDTYNRDKLKKAYDKGYFLFFFINVLKKEAWSSTSYFYRKYNPVINKLSTKIEFADNYPTEDNYYSTENNNITNDTIQLKKEQETQYNSIDQILGEMGIEGPLDSYSISGQTFLWWELTTFKNYYKREKKISYDKLAAETMIPKSTMWTSHRKIINLIKNKTNE